MDRQSYYPPKVADQLRSIRRSWMRSDDRLVRLQLALQYTSARWGLAVRSKDNTKESFFWRRIHHQIEFLLFQVGRDFELNRVAWEKRTGQSTPMDAKSMSVMSHSEYGADDFLMPSGKKRAVTYPHDLAESIVSSPYRDENEEYISLAEFNAKIAAFEKKFLEERGAPLLSEYSITDDMLSPEWDDFLTFDGL